MKVALIDVPSNRITNEPSLKRVMANFGVLPSLSLLYVASTLEKLGVEIFYLDIMAMKLSKEDALNRLQRFSPDVIGFTVYTSHFHQAFEWIRYFKNGTKAKVMVGGVHTSLFPLETLKYIPEVDFVILGEAEVVLPNFIESLKNGNELSRVAGICYRNEKKEICFTGFPKWLGNLDDCPFPARHLVPNERYFNFISERKNYTVCNTSRGCPFRCIFCEAANKKWRARSAKNVVDEFQQCLEKFHIKEIDIFDSSFTISKRRVIDICREIKDRNLHKDIIWDIRSRVDTIDEEMLVELNEAGCYRIFYGIESGNGAILKTLRKAADIEKIERTLRLTKKIGISTFGYFLVGSPGETAQTVRDSINFAKRLPLDFCIFNMLMAFPRTELYEKFYLPYRDDFWKRYISLPEPDGTFAGRPWTELTRNEVRGLTRQAMIEFYFRPIALYRAIRSVRSWHQLRRYVKAGIDMLFKTQSL